MGARVSRPAETPPEARRRTRRITHVGACPWCAVLSSMATCVCCPASARQAHLRWDGGQCAGAPHQASTPTTRPAPLHGRCTPALEQADQRTASTLHWRSHAPVSAAPAMQAACLSAGAWCVTGLQQCNLASARRGSDTAGAGDKQLSIVVNVKVAKCAPRPRPPHLASGPLRPLRAPHRRAQQRATQASTPAWLPSTQQPSPPAQPQTQPAARAAAPRSGVPPGPHRGATRPACRRPRAQPAQQRPPPGTRPGPRVLQGVPRPPQVPRLRAPRQPPRRAAAAGAAARRAAAGGRLRDDAHAAPQGVQRALAALPADVAGPRAGAAGRLGGRASHCRRAPRSAGGCGAGPGRGPGPGAGLPRAAQGVGASACHAAPTAPPAAHTAPCPGSAPPRPPALHRHPRAHCASARPRSGRPAPPRAATEPRALTLAARPCSLTAALARQQSHRRHSCPKERKRAPQPAGRGGGGTPRGRQVCRGTQPGQRGPGKRRSGRGVQQPLPLSQDGLQLGQARRPPHRARAPC